MDIIVAGELVINGEECLKLSTHVEVSEIDKDLESELSGLEAQKQALQLVIRESNAKIERVNLALINSNKELVELVQSLERDRDAAVRAMIEESLKHQGRENPKEPESKSEAPEGEPDVDEWKPATKKIGSKVKRLFARIAKLTHPDKTKKDSEEVSKEKQKLFMKAKLARDDNDYDTLEYIWNKLQNIKSSLWSKLLSKLQLLKQEIDMYSRDLVNIRMSTPYHMATDYELGHVEPVQNHYRQMLLERIDRMRFEIASLKGEG